MSITNFTECRVKIRRKYELYFGYVGGRNFFNNVGRIFMGTEFGGVEREIRQNRKDFPEVAKLVDTLRKQLGDVTVLWCQENGKTLGRKTDDGFEGN
jgi:hypothetical protein